MEDELYERYCNETNTPKEIRKQCKSAIINTMGWQFFLLGVAFEELGKAIKESLPKWLKKHI